jgi:hypothetical protein
MKNPARGRASQFALFLSLNSIHFFGASEFDSIFFDNILIESDSAPHKLHPAVNQQIQIEIDNLLRPHPPKVRSPDSPTSVVENSASHLPDNEA